MQGRLQPHIAAIPQRQRTLDPVISHGIAQSQILGTEEGTQRRAAVYSHLVDDCRSFRVYEGSRAMRTNVGRCERQQGSKRALILYLCTTTVTVLGCR